VHPVRLAAEDAGACAGRSGKAVRCILFQRHKCDAKQFVSHAEPATRQLPDRMAGRFEWQEGEIRTREVARYGEDRISDLRRRNCVTHPALTQSLVSERTLAF